MHETQANEKSYSPVQLVRRFVQCTDDGDIRRELADDCILTLLGRSVKGVAAVTGYMRTQLTARYKHSGFDTAVRCNTSEESLLKERFERSFKVLRRRLKDRAKELPSLTHSRAESDDDDTDVDADVSSSCPNRLVTPPRSNQSASGPDTLHYVSSSGVLEAVRYSDDGGIDLGESCQVALTLGFRSSSLVHKEESALEICLIVYEKLRSRIPLPHSRSRVRTLGLQRHSRAIVLTDDESEGMPAPRSVRRTLFANAECDDPDESLEQLPPVDTLPTLTPRKRQHVCDSKVKSKRSTALGGMRF